MKNLIKLSSFLLAVGYLLTACEGPRGMDANESCTQCHANDQVITAKIAQWETSIHATGGNSERNSSDCAPCHTSQGFLEVNAAGDFTSAPGNFSTTATIDNPNQQNCYTCHAIHDTYTDDDWALTKTTATIAAHSIDGTTPVSVDLGKGNMCTGCHQGRAMDDVLDMTDNTNKITPGSYRFGLHHGPQYNVIASIGLYEFSGSVTYPTAENHILSQTEDACVTCHMNTAYGTQAGGHTMRVAYEYHGNTVPNFPASCAECHSDGGIADPLEDILGEVQDEIETLLADLGTVLEEAGVKQPGTGYIAYSGSVVEPQTEMMLAAFTNYQVFEEDRSKGMHNPKYARAILTNTIEAVEAVLPAK